MSFDTVMRFTAWGVCALVVLQVILHFVFWVMGYDSLVLSITLLTSAVVFLFIFAAWQYFNKPEKTEI
jgi:hypothetical protein